MIIAQRSVRLSDSTDPAARSLRSHMTPTAARRRQPAPEAVGGRGGLDLVRFYPSLFAAAPQPSRLRRSVRAVAFRLTVLGTTAAAMLALMHR